MSKKVQMTNDEKMAQDILGMDGVVMNMSKENHIENLIQQEKARKYNDQVEAYADRFAKHVEDMKESSESLADIENIEIKPMFSRILILPLKQNPFQRIKIENGIVTDLGGFAPNFTNPDTGKEDVMEQSIRTGVVQEIGPEVKYIVPGDVVFYRKEALLPIPFFKQGLWLIDEKSVLTIVNSGLEDRFNNIKNG